MIIVQCAGLCVVFFFATVLKTMKLRIACVSIPDVCIAPRRRRVPTCTREEGAVKPVELLRVVLEFFTCLVVGVFSLFVIIPGWNRVNPLSPNQAPSFAF